MRRAWRVVRLAGAASVIAALVPLQRLALAAGWPLAGRLPQRVHRLLLRALGVRVRVTGSPPPPGSATLVLANHVSWIDIPVIGSLAPLSFVAKSEIARWPVVGALARLQRCIFVDRTRKAATARVNAAVADRLAAGDVVVLFPEGTTGDGIRLLPFRSSLVGAAGAASARGGGDAPAVVRLQPLALAYTARNGLPTGRRDMPSLAWYGDMELAPHVSGFLRDGPLDVVVAWGEPILFGAGQDRKRATRLAEDTVRAAIRRARTAG